MSQQLDYLIKNATIVDGTGAAPYRGVVGIKDGRIALVEQENRPLRADRAIDARGLHLTPGFIDTHASTGFGFFFPHAADHKLYQGITTEIFGNCGTSPAPIGPLLTDKMHELAADLGFEFNWRSLGEYFTIIENIGLQFNVGSLAGHSTLRGGYVHDWNRTTAEELAAMQADMTAAMRDGALGLSTGLIYAPGCFATTDEIVELARIAARRGGVYASHMRDERDKLEEAIEETLTIGQQAGIDVLVSHLKAAERRNFGKIPAVLGRLEAYNRSAAGQAKIDVYPYTAVSTKLRAFIPKELLAGGIEKLPQVLQQEGTEEKIAAHIEAKGYDLSQMLFISADHPQWAGKDLQAIAALEGWSLARTMREILQRDTEVWIVYFCIDRADMDAAILWPQAMICTDSWSHPINAPRHIGVPHPRSYGAFTQYLYDYVIDRPLLTIEEAVRKITFLPASFFRLAGCGRIAEGMVADVVLLNMAEVQPRATYTEPMQLSAGTEWVWVNGRAVIEGGAINDERPGQVLKNSTIY